MKQFLKKIAPRFIHHAYNRIVSKRIIRKQRGDWFDVEWNRKASQSSDRDWVDVYEKSWQHWDDQDLTPDDLQRIARAAGPCESVLDAGCGDGYLLQALQSQSRRVGGIDLSHIALKRAADRLGPDAMMVQGFLEAMPFADNAFEVTVCAHTLEHVKSLDATVAELKRVTRKRLVILVPCQEYLLYTEDYHIHYFPDQDSLLKVVNIPGATCERYEVVATDTKYRGEVLLLAGEIN